MAGGIWPGGIWVCSRARTILITMGRTAITPKRPCSILGLMAGERGFTLPEMTIVIVIMGIVLAISSASWFGAIEGRQVDSAANQVVADLRLAHSTATNRLADQVVTLTADNSTYTMGTRTRDLDDDPGEHKAVVDATVTITFKPDGSATVSPGGTESFQVVSADDGSKAHTINLNTATSRVQVASATP